jgi:3-oxoacyl-[acyl-carrier-protein] synthase II
LRRVVVTGYGCVSPLANGVENTWNKLIAGESGIKKIQDFDVSDLNAKIGGIVPLKIDESVDDTSPYFNPNFYVPTKEHKMMDKFIIFSQSATYQAVKSAGLALLNDEQKERTGVMIGSGIGGLQPIYDNSRILDEKGPRRISPYFLVSTLINLASGFASIKYGFRGPNHAVATACATGTHAIGDAMRMIQMDDADIMIAGGAEAPINRLAIAGFCACKALSTHFNEIPQKASRPWDRDRDGFVMGEGSAVLVLEEYEHAKKRGVPIIAEIIGYGLSGDAHHFTAPPEDGNGALRAMKAALRSAKINTEDVQYINAHGTSTPLGDKAEVSAIKNCFKNYAKKLLISSTKSATGHLLGAAGAIEALFTILSIKNSMVPPTLNLENPDEGCDLNFVPHQAQQKDVKIAMSNSFGFGGTNASLIFRSI